MELALKPRINLFVGDNASGKTTMLKAIRYVLGTFFAGFSDDNTRWTGPQATDFTELTVNGIIQPERPIEIDFGCSPEHYDTVVDNCGNALSAPTSSQVLAKNSKKNSRSLISGLTDWRNYTAGLLKYHMSAEGRQQYALPLLASFSTDDIHDMGGLKNVSAKKFKTYNQKTSFGYYGCLDGNGLLPYWQKRLLILKEGNTHTYEIDIVRDAICRALGTDGCNIISDMDIRPISGESILSIH